MSKTQTSSVIATSAAFPVSVAVSSSSSGGNVAFVVPSYSSRIATSQAIENAIFAHIQALRALGQTTVNTTEIASALHIKPLQVLKAIKSLGSKGVKIAQ